ncbi:MAG: hypothetical protein KDA79_16300 [Planctomycetaceae bacterium]|nr:hypothetical protein [Planctomycetaceae bacterium]
MSGADHIDPAAGEPDVRLYALHPDGWDVRIKSTWEKEYCHARLPGEEHFHLLLCGEIFLAQGGEKFCLQCALRRGVITRNRLYWQRGTGPAGESSAAVQPGSDEAQSPAG